MSNSLIEYMKIHLISLEQDLEDAQNGLPIPEDEYFESDDYYQGAIETVQHLLEVANDNV